MNLEDLIAIASGRIAYGTITISLKKHDGRISVADITQITRHKVEGNAEALTIIGTMLKAMAAAQETGDMTVTVHVNQGIASEIMVHDFERRHAEGNQFVS